MHSFGSIKQKILIASHTLPITRVLSKLIIDTFNSIYMKLRSKISLPLKMLPRKIKDQDDSVRLAYSFASRAEFSIEHLVTRTVTS